MRTIQNVTIRRTFFTSDNSWQSDGMAFTLSVIIIAKHCVCPDEVNFTRNMRMRTYAILENVRIAYTYFHFFPYGQTRAKHASFTYFIKKTEPCFLLENLYFNAESSRDLWAMLIMRDIAPVGAFLCVRHVICKRTSSISNSRSFGVWRIFIWLADDFGRQERQQILVSNSVCTTLLTNVSLLIHKCFYF